jgi:hypothetical protein
VTLAEISGSRVWHSYTSVCLATKLLENARVIYLTIMGQNIGHGLLPRTSAGPAGLQLRAAVPAADGGGTRALGRRVRALPMRMRGSLQVSSEVHLRPRPGRAAGAVTGQTGRLGASETGS